MSIDIGDVRVIRVGIIGLDGDSADAARMAAIEADLAIMLGRPVIVELADIPDVDTSGAVTGDTLIYNATTGKWGVGTVSGAVAYVKKGSSVIVSDADRLNFDTGLNVQQDGLIATQANVFVNFAGPGSANTVARSDHVHTMPQWVPVPFAATGNLSSGARQLAVTNITLAPGIPYRVKAKLRSTTKGSNTSGYYLLFLNIWDGANSVTRTSEQMQCVGGVPDKVTYEHSVVVTGSGASYPVSASIIYDSGDPVDVRAGELIVEAKPTR